MGEEKSNCRYSMAVIAAGRLGRRMARDSTDAGVMSALKFDGWSMKLWMVGNG